MMNGLLRNATTRLGVGLCATALVLAACGGESGSSADADSLTVALGGDPLTINPYDFKAGVNFYAHRQWYETLLTRDKKGELVPSLAEGYEVSDDGLVYTFNLRDGVTFHDGSAMTSEDVKFSIERFADPEVMPYAFLLGAMKSVETPDDLTVVVTFTEPNPQFLSGAGLTFIVPSEIGDQPAGYLDDQEIGTGPVQLVERRKGEGWTMKRYDDYWGDAAGYQNIEVKIIPDANGRVSALRSGQVDFIAPVPPQNVGQLEDQFTVSSTIDGGALGITFDLLTKGEAGVVADQNVRRALDLAIDRGPIIETALAGLGGEYAGVGAQNAGFDDVSATPYDPDEASRLIKEAGAEGATVKLYVPKNGRIVNSEQVGQAVAGYWDAVGIKTDLQLISYEEWIDREKNGPAQTYLSSFPDDFTWNPLVRIQSFYGCNGDNSNQCDEGFDRLVAEAGRAPTDEAFTQGYVAATQYVQDKSMGIQLYQAKSAFAMDKSVCWEPNLGRSIPLLSQVAPCG